MFSIKIKENYVQSRDQDDRLNYITKLAIKMQVMFTKADVTQKPKGVTYQDKSHIKA
jgi:hypothetical protein